MTHRKKKQIRHQKQAYIYR